MKPLIYISSLALSLLLIACTGSKKYFKAAEKMEKMGLVNEAAEFYFQSLQRKPTNVEARLKLKEVGQKHTSGMASEFFRNFNTQQNEASLESYERMKDFVDRCAALNVQMDYPKAYDEDYQKSVELYCSKNYHQAAALVNQKKYNEALSYISKVNRYNKDYKNLAQLSIIATCEPLYQTAITNLQNKNYAPAVQALSAISIKADKYKDAKDLLEMATAQSTKQFILFEPNGASNALTKAIETAVYNNMNDAAANQVKGIKVINNTPFQQTPEAFDFSKSTNVDLIQAIRKATGADYFYFFTVSNAKEFDSGLIKTQKKGFEETRTRKNDTLVIVEYKPFTYNLVKAQRSVSYDFSFKIINALNSQIVASQTKNMQSADAVEYQEFTQPFKSNINNLYPYNPQQTAVTAQYNAKAWRNSFSARNTLKSQEELKTDVYNQNIKLFISSTTSMK
ncbi:MAG: hypothetical protein JNK73_07575 [Bacteroidia bacterium]|nr:hypothetical protein [Bacteroidia bacterium]